MTRMVPGKRYTVTLEGVAKDGGFLVVKDFLRNSETPVYIGGVKDFSSTKVTEIPDPVPTWRPGDVVVVTFERGGTPYTYVRGLRSWPGESANKTDAQMDALFREGKAKPVLQAGGVPFVVARFPRSTR